MRASGSCCTDGEASLIPLGLIQPRPDPLEHGLGTTYPADRPNVLRQPAPRVPRYIRPSDRTCAVNRRLKPNEHGWNAPVHGCLRKASFQRAIRRSARFVESGGGRAIAPVQTRGPRKFRVPRTLGMRNQADRSTACEKSRREDSAFRLTHPRTDEPNDVVYIVASRNAPVVQIAATRPRDRAATSACILELSKHRWWDLATL
jgi:hypothetical protein